eukprot:1147937-Pelagomonas_calceolata.AAC.7
MAVDGHTSIDAVDTPAWMLDGCGWTHQHAAPGAACLRAAHSCPVFLTQSITLHAFLSLRLTNKHALTQ